MSKVFRCTTLSFGYVYVRFSCLMLSNFKNDKIVEPMCWFDGQDIHRSKCDLSLNYVNCVIDNVLLFSYNLKKKKKKKNCIRV